MDHHSCFKLGFLRPLLSILVIGVTMFIVASAVSGCSELLTAMGIVAPVVGEALARYEPTVQAACHSAGLAPESTDGALLRHYFATLEQREAEEAEAKKGDDLLLTKRAQDATANALILATEALRAVIEKRKVPVPPSEPAIVYGDAGVAKIEDASADPQAVVTQEPK